MVRQFIAWMRGMAKYARILVVGVLGAVCLGLAAWCVFAWLIRPYAVSDGNTSTTILGNVVITDHARRCIFGAEDLKMTFDLPVRNWWEKPVHFTKVVASCACSKAELAASELPPGGQTTLHLDVSLPDTGAERRIACELLGEDGKRAVHRVTVTGYPYVQLDSETGGISIGTVKPRQEVSIAKDLFLHAPDAAGGAPVVISADGESKAVDVSVNPPSEAERLPGGGLRAAARLNLHLRTGTVAGLHATNVSIRYEIQGVCHEKIFPITWKVASIFALDPARIFLSVKSGDVSPVERTVALKHNDGQAFTIKSVRALAPWLQPTFRAGPAAASHKIPLRIQLADVRAKSTSTVEITTDDALQPLVEVPVFVFRQKTETDK